MCQSNRIIDAEDEQDGNEQCNAAMGRKIYKQGIMGRLA